MLGIQRSIGETTTRLDYEGVIRGHSPHFGTTDAVTTEVAADPRIALT